MPAKNATVCVIDESRIERFFKNLGLTQMEQELVCLSGRSLLEHTNIPP